MKLFDFVTWLLSNKTEALGDVAALIGSASVFVASAAKLLDLLTTLFPALKGVDGKVHWAAAWLSVVAGSKFLNAVALNPVTPVPLAPAATVKP